jgi:hypothetical protein
VDSSGYIELEDGVNEEDNIKFVLLPDDREYYYEELGVYISEIRVEFVPNEVASDVILIEIENGKSVTALSDKQDLGMIILEDEGLIVWSDEYHGFTNQAGKLLYTANDEMEAVLGEDVTAADNISFVLPQDLRDDLHDFYGLDIAEVRMNFIVEEPTYKVSFVANGGTGTMADVTDVSGEYTLPANGFTAPTGKQFKAWSVDGTEKAAGDKITVTADTIVTAVWENIPHTCTLTPVAKVDPTCTEKGKEAYYTCSGCGKYYEDALGEEEIPDLIIWGNIDTIDHIDDDGNGTCDKCRGSVSGNGTGGGSTSGPDETPDELPGDVDAGDSNMAWMWIAMLLISGAGVAAVVALRKKLYFEK